MPQEKVVELEKTHRNNDLPPNAYVTSQPMMGELDGKATERIVLENRKIMMRHIGLTVPEEVADVLVQLADILVSSYQARCTHKEHWAQTGSFYGEMSLRMRFSPAIRMSCNTKGYFDTFDQFYHVGFPSSENTI